MNPQSTQPRSRAKRLPQAATLKARRAAKAARGGAARTTLRGAVAGVVRGAILQAAESVFGEVGFADAKIAAVAQRAGLAAGTLYNYYDSKESLFRALIERRAEEFMGGLEGICERFEPGPDPLAELAALTEATFAYIESHAPVFMLFEQVGGPASIDARRVCGPSGDRLRGRYLQLFQDTLGRAVRAGQLRADVPVDDLALIYAGSMQGLSRGWLLAGRKGRLKDRAQVLLSVFLAGIGKKKR